MKQYYELASFKGIYLEDSYVLGFEETESQLVFAMEFVLTPENVLYGTAEENEQYFYRKGKLLFPGLKDVVWLDKTFRATTDAAGEIDYGNIDVCQLEDDGYFFLCGDWGRVKILSLEPRILYD